MTRTIDGWLLFLAACALPALAYVLESSWPVVGLLVLLVVFPPTGASKPRRRAAKPSRETDLSES